MSKLSKDELRSPDQIWVASAQSFKWIQSHGAKLLLLLGLLLISSIGFFYFQQQKAEKEAGAQAVFGEALNLFEQWELAAESAKTEAEAELQKRLDQLNESHSDSDANHLASLFRAKVEIYKNNLEASLTHLDHYLKVLPKNQRVLGLYPKSVVLEGLTKWDEALNHYEEILNQESRVEMKKWALLGKARSLENLDRKEEAKKTYDQFLSEYPASPEVSYVRGLRARVQTP